MKLSKPAMIAAAVVYVASFVFVLFVAN